MENTKSQVRAVAKLNELTQRGALHWKIGRPPDTTKTDESVELAYETEYEGQRLRIFSRNYRTWQDEEQYLWNERPVLQVIDEEHRALYEFPSDSGIADLLVSVQYQVSGVGRLIEKLERGA